MAIPSDQLDALYAGPLEDFTAARNALAKKLREEGESEAAAEVKKLRKPTRAAWIVNQLARRKRRDVGRLLATGEELRELQQRMSAGSVDPPKLRAAAGREQKQVGALLKAAESIGTEHGSQILDRVGETLRAASGDPEVADAVRRGQLDRERRASGIGLSGALDTLPEKAKKGSAEDTAAGRLAERESARRRKQAERKLASAEKRTERARAALERARATVDEREEAMRVAERDRDAARRAVKERMWAVGLDA